MLELVFYILMAAPSATDDHLENYSFPLGSFPEAEYCTEALNWLNENGEGYSRHLWCKPVRLTIEEGEPA